MKNIILKVLTSILILSFVFSSMPQTINAAARKTDRVAPTAPCSVKCLAVTDTAITISWLASRDAVGVKSYAVYRNGVRVATVNGLVCTITGLRPSKSYKFTVRAFDAAGNRSKSSSVLIKKTLSKSTAPISPQIPTTTAAPVLAAPAAAVPEAIVVNSPFPTQDFGTLFHDAYRSNPDVITSSDGVVMIDTGRTPDGVILVKIHAASMDKAWKAIVKGPTGSYSYALPNQDRFEGLPLQMGNGSYLLTIYEQVSGTSYTTKMTHGFEVNLRSALSPFTVSSIMVDFSTDSASTLLASSLVAGKSTQESRINAIYQWIVNNIQYDRDLAASITSGAVKTHMPNPDATLASRKGICYDYAALLSAMLRSQGIPARLVKGQVPMGYHAWNEVYLEGSGWFRIGDENYSQVNGSDWVMLDPTFSASGMSPETVINMTHLVERIY